MKFHIYTTSGVKPESAFFGISPEGTIELDALEQLVALAREQHAIILKIGGCIFNRKSRDYENVDGPVLEIYDDYRE